jgi:hypothetical protein
MYSRLPAEAAAAAAAAATYIESCAAAVAEDSRATFTQQGHIHVLEIPYSRPLKTTSTKLAQEVQMRSMLLPSIISLARATAHSLVFQ